MCSLQRSECSFQEPGGLCGRQAWACMPLSAAACLSKLKLVPVADNAGLACPSLQLLPVSEIRIQKLIDNQQAYRLSSA